MAYDEAHNQYVDRIAMEVAPSKLPSVVTARGSRLAVVLDTIQEDDDREAGVQSPRMMPPPPPSSSHKAASRRGMEAVADTPMHCVAGAAFLAPAMAKTGCLKVRA